jgi:hypothetical protein
MSFQETNSSYHFNNFSKLQKYKVKGQCLECHTPLTNKSTVKCLHLCSICAVITHSQIKPNNININELFDPDFLSRELKASYDVWSDKGIDRSSYHHTKAYTCYNCCSAKSYNNPFKQCIECVLKLVNINNIKYTACHLLENSYVSPLLTIRIVKDYLLKRKWLHTERRNLIRSVHSFANVSDCVMVNGYPEDSQCPPDDSDKKALESWTKRKIKTIMDNTSLDPDSTSIVVSLEDKTYGCDWLGKAIKQ